MSWPNLNSVASPVPEIMAIAVLGFGKGLRIPNLREEEAIGGEGWYTI